LASTQVNFLFFFFSLSKKPVIVVSELFHPLTAIQHTFGLATQLKFFIAPTIPAHFLPNGLRNAQRPVDYFWSKNV